MDESYITYILVAVEEGERLPIDRVAAAGARLSDEFLYHGNFTYLPLPDGSAAIAVSHGRSTPEMTEWLIRTIAFELQAVVLDEEGAPAFLDSDDNDISFLDSVPAPEEDVGPIRLQFSISLPRRVRTERIMELIDEFGYEVNAEADGIAIALSASIYMDLFFEDGDTTISGDVDLSFGGARLYLDALQLAMKLSHTLGGRITATPDARITYPADRDVEKLRRVFYLPLKQQLCYAVTDDREGIQAFFGWGTDNLEPLDIPGTMVSPFGRLDIERLKREIRTWGFSVIADHCMLACNTPSRGTGFYVRSALIHAWNSWLGRPLPEGDAVDLAQYTAEPYLVHLEEALKLSATAPFPTDFYKKLCECSGHVPLDTSACAPYSMHFEPGYRLDDVFYGFGHYLRRVRLPGRYPSYELNHGFNGVIIDDLFPENALSVEFAIKYFDYDAEPTENFGHNFAEGEVETFDIGGSSYCRFCRGGEKDGRHLAEAEITIRDERYHFAISAKTEELVDMVRDALYASRSIEEWYDDYGGEEFDPHAPGGTFCINGDLLDPSVDNPFPDERYEHFLLPGEIEEEDTVEEMFQSMFGISYGNYQNLLPVEAPDRPFASKLGGEPCLPDGMEPPRVPIRAETVFEGVAGRPLSFIGQINLADVVMPGFPTHGMISLWGLRDDRREADFSTNVQSRFRVLYFADAPDPEEDIDENTTEKATLFVASPPASPERAAAVSRPPRVRSCRIGGAPELAAEASASYDTLLLRIDNQNARTGLATPYPDAHRFVLEFAINGAALRRGDFSDVLITYRVLE